MPDTDSTGLPPQFKAVDPAFNIGVPVTVAGHTFQVREMSHVRFVEHALLLHQLVLEVQKQHPDKPSWREIALEDVIRESLPKILMTGHELLVAFVADACRIDKADPKLADLPMSAFIELTMTCIEAQRPTLLGFTSAAGRFKRMLGDKVPQVTEDGNHVPEPITTGP